MSENKKERQAAEEQKNELVDVPESEQPEAEEANGAARYEEELTKLKDMYLRAMAETENVRARAKRENEDTAKYAATKFAREMVNILENLVRASASITPEHRASSDVVKQVADGIDMTIQELRGIFERNGIRRIDPVGQKFDHTFHQAVAQVAKEGAEPGTVLEVLQAGYTLHDRLLRPAMVSVVAQPAQNDATGTAG